MKTLQVMAFAACMAAAAYAIPVNSNRVSNTGTSGAGCIGTVTLTAGCTVAANGTVGDPNYTLTAVPSGSTATVALRTQFPAGGDFGIWVPPNNTSSWISPNNGNSNQASPAGLYTYTQTFNLGVTSPAYNLVGRWSSDNDAALYFNGTQFSSIGQNGFDNWTPFTVGSGFQVGLNTLTFVVQNRNRPVDAMPTPTGLRVEFSSVFLPEAHELTVLSLMLGGLTLWGLKRRKLSLEA